MHPGHPSHSPDQPVPAPGPPLQLAITGMSCSNCARHVLEAIEGVPGVRGATVSLESRQAAVRWIAGAEPNVTAIIQAVEAEGYGARAIEAGTRSPNHGEHALAGWELNLWIGVLGTAPLMIGEWVFGLGTTPWFRWLSFALASLVQLFAGAPFYRGAWNQLKAGSSNMDTLVALGSTTAFAYSVWALFAGLTGHVYFMEAAAIITLISVGHWMESRVSAHASDALRKLLTLTPQTARRLDPADLPHPPSSRSAHEPAFAPFLSPHSGENSPAAAGMRQGPLSFRFKATTDAGNGVNPLPVPAPAGRPASPDAPQAVPAGDRRETEVPVAELNAGDLVALRPGDGVPTDGEVVAGDSAVDESMLTGESVPVDKAAGSSVYAGTLNLNGRLVLRVTATGEATALAHIVAAVQRAQSSRANIQRLGDRVSSVFVPAVVAIAILTGLWWGLAPDSAGRVHGWLAPFLWPVHQPMTALAAAVITAAAVLIVACPCAMGLATPAAIMAGSNAAARRGILIRDGVALEKAGNITAVLFDKTGTLTAGKPAVAKVWENPTAVLPVRADAAENQNAETKAGATPILLYAASLARPSAHPISQAIAKAGSSELEIKEWQELRGAGVQGRLPILDPRISPPPLARLGSLKWLRETGVDLAAGEPFIAEWSAQGATLVGLAFEKSLLGLMAVKDTVKPGAGRVVAQLHRQGLKTWLVTGDNALTAAGIAKQTGIRPENVLAEVRPEQKAELVKRLQQQGERVAFVGDGINDAPALEQADLGIAVSRASDIAREAADIILLNSEIEAVPESLGLARATLRTIKQNLFWAFFYNAVGVPLAALGFMSPILCAAAMGFSDLIVIGNALRLRRWKLRPGP
jgi:P-type Cu+ transporter